MEPGEFDQASFIDDFLGSLSTRLLVCIYVGSCYVWSLGGACCTSVRVMVHVYCYLWSELESGPYYFMIPELESGIGVEGCQV